ncbi:MAG: insulinase family protein [Candidatus Obscuribacterales bacterium]|nr:insulinase family protein [Candidatus Obscuribacterales bacterium]
MKSIQYKLQKKCGAIALAFGLLSTLLPLPARCEIDGSSAPQVKEIVLENGLKVLLFEEHSFPVFSSMVFYKVGSRNENLGETGLSHLVEHLLFQKVSGLRKGEIGALIARNGGMFNGFTSDDFTVFFETMAPAKLELALRLESARMKGSGFSADDVSQEIKRIEKELEQEAKDQVNLLVKEVRSAAFTRHPYKNPTIGWPSDVQKLTLDDAKRHYKQFYQPGNATLVIVGDFDSNKAGELVRKYFGPLAKGDAPPPVRVSEPPQHAEKRIYMKYGGASDVVSLAYHVPGFADADTAALAVLEKVLYSGVGGRLRSKLIDGKLCSTVRSAFEVKRDPSLFAVTLQGAGGIGASKVLEGFDSALEQVKAGAISDSELKRAKNHAEFQLLVERDGPYRLAFHLGFFDGLDNWQAAYSWQNRIKAVTAQDVQRVAKRYFSSENRVVGILAGAAPKSAPKSEPKEKESKDSKDSKDNKSAKENKDAKAKNDKSEDKSTKTKPSEKGAKPSKKKASLTDLLSDLCAYKDNDGAAVDAPRRLIAENAKDAPSTRDNIKRGKLRNGMTIAVLETKVSPVVQIAGAVKAGEAYEPVGKRGVSSLLASLMNEGSAGMTRNQAVTKQDELGLAPATMVKFDSGPQWISFQARCLSRDAGNILAIMAGQLLEPQLIDESFESAKARAAEKVRHQENTVEQRVDRALLQGLIAPNTSFYPMEPVDKARFIGNLKLADAKEFHAAAVKPDAATLVFVGDISLEQAVSLGEKYFGSWSGKSAAKKVSVQPNPKRLLKNSIIIEKRTDSMITLGKLIDTGAGAPDYPLLLLSDCALTSHPIFSRFAQKISGESSLMSSLSLEDLSSDVESLPGTTLWTIELPVVANNLPAVFRNIEGELKRFSRQGVSESELAETKLFMYGGLPVRWMSNSHLAARTILETLVLSNQPNPLPELTAGIKAVSLDGLNKFIKEKFKPERASLVVAGTKQTIGQIHGLKQD